MHPRGTPVRFGGAVAVALMGATLTACAATSPSPPAPVARIADAPASSRSLVTMPVPLRVAPPADLPVVDLKPGLATWRAGVDAEDAIRIMTPVTIRSMSGSVEAAPADYHAYLAGLERRGARITDDRAITVDGVPAHLMTLTSTRIIETGLGCWSDSPDTCFGLAPELVLRVATFTVGGRPVVLWARTTAAHPSGVIVATFERMLRTVRFSR